MCNRYNNFCTDALFYILGCFYWVFVTRCIFYTYSSSLFGLAVVQVLSSHMLLMAPVLDSAGVEDGRGVYSIHKP